MKSGKGRLEFFNGDVYFGEWKYDKFNGKVENYFFF